ncbi:hypothetical protein [Burkholderia pyrrocinia]
MFGDRLIRIDRPVLVNGTSAGRRSVDRYNYDVNVNLKSVYVDGGNQKGKARAFSYWADLRRRV